MKKEIPSKIGSSRPIEIGFFVAGCLFAFLLLVEFLFERLASLHFLAQVFLVLAACASFYTAAYLYADRTAELQRLRRAQILILVVFILCLADITLIGSSVGRLHFPGTREDYLELFVNFHPFRTICNYLRGFLNGYLALWRLVLNLLGNFFLLSPFALILPILFRYERKWYVFLPTVLAVSCSVEALQYLFMAGSCDVDDLILNFLGATAVFFFLKIPPLRRLIRIITKSGF